MVDLMVGNHLNEGRDVVLVDVVANVDQRTEKVVVHAELLNVFIADHTDVQTHNHISNQAQFFLRFKVDKERF